MPWEPLASVAVATAAAAAGSPILEIQSNIATTRHNLGILSIGLVSRAATAATIGVQFTNAKGTVAGGEQFTFQVEDSADANVIPVGSGLPFIAKAWTAAPTIDGTSPPMRQVTLPAVAGAAVEWSWAENSPLLLRVNASNVSLVVWNFGAGAAPIFDAYVRTAIGTMPMSTSVLEALGVA